MYMFIISEAMAQVNIREARKSDCGLLLQLIQESAIDRKLPRPNFDAKALEENGWGTSPSFKSLTAETEEGLLVGFVLFFYTYSTWEGCSVFMEDLYVTHAYRRKGIASRLWKKLVQTALDAECSRCNLVLLESNALAITFCEKLGAVDLTKTEGWHYFRMNRDAMDAFLMTKKSIDGVEIRAATGKDCLGIRKLIQDLADYEKMPEGPQLDVKQLEEDSTRRPPFFKAIVAEEEDTIVGYALFFYTYTWDSCGVYMEDLYVCPSHRGRGIGMALWKNVVQASTDVGGLWCDFSVLDWNTKSINVYKSKGAANLTQQKGYHCYRMVKDRMKTFIAE
ncbi:uncharacterized protein [Panulirus ornatus]|uniref:uncharacterized protein isoform X2 n=1 Tax=Panulirus ornatus TaxID=150431 RepID=UPI003A8520AA